MPIGWSISLYVMVFIFGIVIGSFCNVCIYRIPKQESVVTPRSHCMYCGTGLKWYELIPLLSFLIQRGRCRSCKAKLSLQYPLVEAANGGLYVLIFAVNGWNWESGIYCLAASALLVLSVIDARTMEIPLCLNWFMLGLGATHAGLDYFSWIEYLIGFFAVSVFLWLLYLATKGKGIGGGDIKLMATAGLLLGWQKIILAFVIGCILGSVIHVIRMKVSKAEHVLALGPYLSAGILIAALWGDSLVRWYMSLLGL